MAVRVHKMNATMRVVDGDALLTRETLERILAAVTDAMDAQRDDDRSRRRDTKIGTCCAGDEHESES